MGLLGVVVTCDEPSAAPMMDRIGGYEIRRLLARGEMANVYECRHATLGRPAALKLLHPHLAGDASASGRFLNEARAMARISHPNVVEVFEAGEHKRLPYVAVALVEGDDLPVHLAQRHPMVVSDIADCILPIVAAVAAASDAGVVHREVKPRNVRIHLDYRGRHVPVVLDFGISKLTGDERGQKRADIDELLGTASYMAPEQIHSARRIGLRGEVYTLGVILYLALTGKRPFQGDSAADLVRDILTAHVSPPSFLRPDIPAGLDAIVMRAMGREPSERFATARELGCAVAAFASRPAAWRDELMPRSGTRWSSDGTMVSPDRAFRR